MRKAIALSLLLLCACTPERLVRRTAPGARIWFETKEGPGEPVGAGGGKWAHWDSYFHSRTHYTDWVVSDREISAIAHESNDFYRLLEWTPQPYLMTWWLDGEGRVTGKLVSSIPAPKPMSRMNEMKAWARKHHPEELAYLMPNDALDPTGDRPERWKRLLTEWREDAKSGD